MPSDLQMLSSIQIGRFVAKNRIMVAAHSYGYVDDDGLPTEKLVDYLTERAKGGVGTIVLGGTSISKDGALVERILMNIDDQIVPWYEKISRSVHSFGTLIFDQLMHVGGQLDIFEGSRIVGPSPIPHEMCNSIPLELTLAEIKSIIHNFTEAATRVQKGGFDGVEIKCDQGFLIHQFLSPYYNRRTDQFGGSYENRLRFLVDLLDEIRGAVGKDLILGIRITGDSLTVGDLTIDETCQIVRDIYTQNKIDYVSVNGATNSTYPGYLHSHGDSSIGTMNFVSYARKVKEQVSIPVVAASMISSPQEAEDILNSGYADLVAMTRAHIADPEIVNKVIEGRVETIRPCIWSNQGCVGNHWKGNDIHCIYNAATGRERELGIGTLIKADGIKKIGVVGGGPAGLEFARVAAARGHNVVVFERSRQLGGQALMASKFPYRQGFLDMINFLERDALRNKVQIYKGINITQDDVLTGDDFDLWVMATGSEPYIPPIYAVDPSRILTIKDIAENNVQSTEHVLIVNIDWRPNGLAVAEKLLQHNCHVTIVSPSLFVGDGLDVATLTSFRSRLDEHVQMFPNTTFLALKQNTARLKNVFSDREFDLSPVDSIVFITGAIAQNHLYNSAVAKNLKVLAIGDCLSPAGIPEAILDANRKARMV
jgi:2,4-dienoyl-CoA reductase-like NADH-dependent reductase (Old Yellow Enzyme family)